VYQFRIIRCGTISPLESKGLIDFHVIYVLDIQYRRTLALLDLNASSDCVDHNILLPRSAMLQRHLAMGGVSVCLPLEVCMGMAVPIGMAVPMGFQREWELDLNKHGNGNGNLITWEWERLMLVDSQNHSLGLLKSHYTTLCALCLRLSHKGP